METVENSAKNNCAEFSPVPTAPTTISFKKGKQNVRSEVSSELHGQDGVRSVKRTQSRPRLKWPVLTRPRMAAFEVITEGKTRRRDNRNAKDYDST